MDGSGDEGSPRLERDIYSYVFQDIVTIKTMLLKLKRVLQEVIFFFFYLIVRCIVVFIRCVIVLFIIVSFVSKRRDDSKLHAQVHLCCVF